MGAKGGKGEFYQGVVIPFSLPESQNAIERGEVCVASSK